MFSFVKRKQKKPSKEEINTTQDERKGSSELTPSTIASKDSVSSATSSSATQTPSTDDLSLSLEKTRHNFSDGLANFMLGKKNLDQNLFDELEVKLLSADVGLDATSEIIEQLQKNVSRRAIDNASALRLHLADIMSSILEPCEQILDTTQAKPFVILVVGINGAGKTTSIGKLAHHYQKQGKSVMLAAGDTFRAAAVEQLQQWGERNKVTVVSQKAGADPASVVFDALQSATAKNIDIVIADTAGRLHTQDNLMAELAKIKRILTKLDANAPHETLMVMDACFGQNALHQVEQFHKSVGLTGLAISKLDGTAKGGILFSIAKTLNLPVRFLGTGENIDDFRSFKAKEFVDALLQ